MRKQKFVTAKNNLGYAEEYITVKGKRNNHLLKYSLSNSLEEIKIAIYARTGLDINLERAYWRLDSEMPVSVKHLLNRHHANFALTIFDETGGKLIIVNMRVGDDKWFETLFFEFEGKIHSFGSWFNYLSKKYFSKNTDDGE